MNRDGDAYLRAVVRVAGSVIFVKKVDVQTSGGYALTQFDGVCTLPIRIKPAFVELRVLRGQLRALPEQLGCALCASVDMTRNQRTHRACPGAD